MQIKASCFACLIHHLLQLQNHQDKMFYSQELLGKKTPLGAIW